MRLKNNIYAASMSFYMALHFHRLSIYMGDSICA